LKRNS